MIYIHIYILIYIYTYIYQYEQQAEEEARREMRLMRLTRQPFNLSSKAFCRSAALPLCSDRLSLSLPLSLPLLLFCLRCSSLSVCLSVRL